MLIVLVSQRHSEVLGQCDNLHNRQNRLQLTPHLSAAAQLCDLSPCANKQIIASENTKLNTCQNARKTQSSSKKSHLHPLHFNTFEVPAVTSLVVSHTYRRINRPPSHKSSTRKAWTVYLSGIPTQPTSWPKHMLSLSLWSTKTPQETAPVCLNTCHDFTCCSYIFVPLCWSRTNFTIPPAWKSKVQFHQRSSRDFHLASSSYLPRFACLATARTWREQDLQKDMARLSVNPCINQQKGVHCVHCVHHILQASSIFVEVLGRRRKRRPPSCSNGSCHLAQMSNVIVGNNWPILYRCPKGFLHGHENVSKRLSQKILKILDHQTLLVHLPVRGYVKQNECHGKGWDQEFLGPGHSEE